MSEYTREEILKLIEENGGPEGLDLSGKDLSGIDLSSKAISKEVQKIARRLRGEKQRRPVWAAETVKTSPDGIEMWGINLHKSKLAEANLREANLIGAHLQKADLWKCQLERANLWAVDLLGSTLREANLQKAYLLEANMQQANLREADLKGAYVEDANLSGAILWKANLEGAHSRYCDLRDAYLLEANLRNTDFERARLQRADLSGAQLAGVNLFGAELANTRVAKVQIEGCIRQERAGVYDEAREIYLALKNNFSSLGQYDDASWAYQKERQMEKAASAPWRARRFYGRERLGDTLEHRLPLWHPRVLWFYLRHTTKWLADWGVELVCGYGEGIRRVLASMVVLLAIFTLGYWLAGGVVDQRGNVSHQPLDYIIYTLGGFTTTGFEDLQPRSDAIKFWTTIEAILGIALTGLLGFVLGNRIRRS